MKIHPLHTATIFTASLLCHACSDPAPTAPAPSYDGGGGSDARARSDAFDASDGAVEGCALCTVLAAPPEGVDDALAIDSDNVYFNKSPSLSLGSIRKVPIGGGPFMELVAELENPREVAVNGNDIFWVAEGKGRDGFVCKAPLSGGPPTFLAWKQNQPLNLALDATHVYWTTFQGGTVMKLPIDAPGGAPFELAANRKYPESIAVDATHVYWAEQGEFRNGAVMSVPKDGGAPTAIASAQVSPGNVTFNESYVFWATRGGEANSWLDAGRVYGAIMMAPRDGSPPIERVSGLPFGASFAVDESYIYFTTPGTRETGFRDGTVARVLTRGGEPEILATRQRYPNRVVVDESHVYFTAGGAVIKVPKFAVP